MCVVQTGSREFDRCPPVSFKSPTSDVSALRSSIGTAFTTKRENDRCRMELRFHRPDLAWSAWVSLASNLSLFPYLFRVQSLDSVTRRPDHDHGWGNDNPDFRIDHRFCVFHEIRLSLPGQGGCVHQRAAGSDSFRPGPCSGMVDCMAHMPTADQPTRATYP